MNESTTDGQKDPLTELVIGAAIEVHRALGPGLLDSASEACLCFELEQRHLAVQRQVPLPIVYKEVQLDCGYCIDILVRDALIIELKTVDHILPIHEAQLLTYLKLMKLHTGLLLNFNVPVLKLGIKRVVL